MPVFEQFGNALPQVSTTRFDTSGLSAGTDTLGSLAQLGADVAIKVKDNRSKLKAATLTNQAAEELENFAFELKTDRDYSTQFERYVGFTKEITQRYEKQFDDDGQGFATFKSNVGKLAFKRGLEVRSQSLNGEIDIQKGQLDLNMASLSRLAVRGDGEQKEAVTERAQGLIADAYKSGVVTYEEAAGVHLKFKDSVSSAQIRYDILTDPDGAAEKLLKGEYDVSDERSLTWLEKANSAIEAKQRARFSEQDRTRREREKLEKEAESSTVKAGDKLLFAGDLTEDWIEANRDNMPESDYRYFYKALKGGDEAVVTDPNIYASLRQKASDGEDVREEARGYLVRRLIDQGSYDKLINRSEKNLPGGVDLPNWFKRGERFIGGALRVSDVNPDPAAAQRQADALDEWTQWAIDNPAATMQEARTEYKAIKNEFALIRQEFNPLTAPLPRKVVGNRREIDFDATIDATNASFEAGEINRDELNKQGILIKQWENALTSQAEASRARDKTSNRR